MRGIPVSIPVPVPINQPANPAGFFMESKHMDGFLFGLVVGVIVGGFVVDVNIRCPAAIKSFFEKWFPASE